MGNFGKAANGSTIRNRTHGYCVMKRIMVQFSLMKQRNPFVLVGYEGPEYFCDRIVAEYLRHLGK